MNTKLAAFIISFTAVVLIITTTHAYRRNRLSTRIFFMWLFIWSSIGFFALFPSLVDKVMELAHMTIRMNFILMSAILLIFIIIFYISSKTAVLARKVSKLSQDIAILNYRLEEEISGEDSKTQQLS